MVPTIFNNTPKLNCYYTFTEISYQPQQNLFVVPVIKILGKNYHYILCMIINTSPDNVILPKHWYIGKMILLNNSDDSWHPPSVSEVTHNISLDHIDVQYPKMHSFSQTSCKIHSNLRPIPETLLLMPSNLQVHRQAPLNNAKYQTIETFYAIMQILCIP